MAPPVFRFRGPARVRTEPPGGLGSPSRAASISCEIGTRSSISGKRTKITSRGDIRPRGNRPSLPPATLGPEVSQKRARVRAVRTSSAGCGPLGQAASRRGQPICESTFPQHHERMADGAGFRSEEERRRVQITQQATRQPGVCLDLLLELRSGPRWFSKPPNADSAGSAPEQPAEFETRTPSLLQLHWREPPA